MHPDFVEAIMPMGGVTESDASLRWLFRLMTAAIESDPAWLETAGAYYHLPKERHPYRASCSDGPSDHSHGDEPSTTGSRRAGRPSRRRPSPGICTGRKGRSSSPTAANYDANDLLYRNRRARRSTVTGRLDRIRARTLILHVANDHWSGCAWPARPTSESRLRLCSFEHPLGHYALFQAPNVFRDTIPGIFGGRDGAPFRRTDMNRRCIEIFNEALPRRRPPRRRRKATRSGSARSP
jgi:hypothetical protein